MKKIAIGLVMACLVVGGLAYAGNIAAVYVKAASATAPALNTDGIALNTANVGSVEGAQVVRAKIVLSGADIVSGRINMWRFVKDAGWAREQHLDMLIGDGGYPSNLIYATSLPEISYVVQGLSSRIDAQAINILQGDGGTGVPVMRIYVTHQ